jgi:hypothetical protein
MHRLISTGVQPLSQSMVVAVLLSACMTWRPEPTRPADLISREKPPLVRVTRTDSSRAILRNPEVRGDSLYGLLQKSLDDDSKVRTGFPLTDISTVETRRSDGTRTVLLGAGIAVGTFTLLCLGDDAFGCGEDPVFAVSAAVK